MATTSVPRIMTVRGGATKRSAIPWCVLGIAACVFGIFWAAISWSGPNVRFSAMDLTVHRMTRLLFATVFLVGAVELFTMMRMAVGWLPTAVVRVPEAEGIEVAATPWLPGFRPRFTSIAGPVAVALLFHEGKRQMADTWDLWFTGHENSKRVGTIWPLRQGDVDAIAAELQARDRGAAK